MSEHEPIFHFSHRYDIKDLIAIGAVLAALVGGYIQLIQRQEAATMRETTLEQTVVRNTGLISELEQTQRGQDVAIARLVAQYEDLLRDYRSRSKDPK